MPDRAPPVRRLLQPMRQESMGDEHSPPKESEPKARRVDDGDVGESEDLLNIVTRLDNKVIEEANKLDNKVFAMMAFGNGCN